MFMTIVTLRPSPPEQERRFIIRLLKSRCQDQIEHDAIYIQVARKPSSVLFASSHCKGSAVAGRSSAIRSNTSADSPQMWTADEGRRSGRYHPLQWRGRGRRHRATQPTTLVSRRSGFVTKLSTPGSIDAATSGLAATISKDSRGHVYQCHPSCCTSLEQKKSGAGSERLE